MYKKRAFIPKTDGKFVITSDAKIYNTRSMKPVKQRLRAGYYAVNLTVRGNTKTYLVHRLMGLSFLPNPLGKEEINHIDGDKLNNKLENLEWCTRSENEKHKHKLLQKKRNNG